MRILIALLALFCIGLANPAVYAKASVPKKMVQPKATQQVIIYATAAKNANVVTKVDPWKTLIPIYQQGNWVKVGDPTDGKVGWINLKQYHTAVDAFTKAQTKTIYVQSTAKPGKEILVAYENGKKVSEKRAKELYKQIKAQQLKTEEQMRKMQRQMQKMFQDFVPMPIITQFPIMPTIIVVQQPK